MVGQSGVSRAKTEDKAVASALLAHKHIHQLRDTGKTSKNPLHEN